MQVHLSIMLLLRNGEPAVAAMVRRAAELGRSVGGVGGVGEAGEAGRFEILALDEHSGDNTLSLLSVLHSKLPELRTMQEVREGTAVAHAARTARGQHWLFMDRKVDVELMRWGVRQLASGHRAAIVPGEILAVEARIGAHVLGNLYGGLVSAQQAVARELAARGARPVTRPAPDRGLRERASLFLRGHLGMVGLGQLDRPRES